MFRSFIASVLVLGLAVSPAAAKGGGGKGGGHGHGKAKAHDGGPPEHAKAKRRGHGVAAGHVAAPVTVVARSRPRVAVVSRAARPARVRTRVVTTRTPSRVVTFADRDRDVVRRYYVESTGRGDCPPGLAKKDNGCLPPGQAKKLYVVGQPLARTVVVEPLPPVLVQRLGPAAAGYEYVMVDGDVLKLAIGTRLVVDAIRYLAR